MEYDENKSQIDIDWENRTLCADESCIGVIGPDGRCKECGKPFENGQNQAASPVMDDADSSHEESFTEDDEYESASDIDWENRTLCADESCIGVIGSDGRCKECGRPFEKL